MILVHFRVLLWVYGDAVECELALWVAHVPVHAVVLLLFLFLIHVASARIELPLVSGRLNIQLFNRNSEREFLPEVLVVVIILESNMHPIDFEPYVLEDEADVLHLLLFLDQAISQLLHLGNVLCVLH